MNYQLFIQFEPFIQGLFETTKFAIE